MLPVKIYFRFTKCASFIVLSLGLLCCTPAKYITKKQSEVSPTELENSVVNYIPLPDEWLQKSQFLDSCYVLLTEKRYHNLDKYIQSKEASGMKPSEGYLAKTLLLITKLAYPEALQNITKIEDNDFLKIRQLLTIDLNYEIARQNGNVDFKSVLNAYQTLVDSNPDDLLLKKIVSIRLRYLRYNN